MLRSPGCGMISSQMRLRARGTDRYSLRPALHHHERFHTGATPCAIRPTPEAIANRATVQHLITEALKPRLAAHVWTAQDRRRSPPPRCRPWVALRLMPQHL